MAQTRSASKLSWNILSYAVLIFLAVLSIGPLLWMLLTSFKVEDDIVTRTMVYFPTRFTFEWYTKLWNQSGYPVLVINSLVTTAMTVAICLFTGTIASYAFSRFHFPGRTPLMLGYLVVRMFPAVLMIIPLFIVMRNLGLFDTSIGLAVAYTSFLLPLFVWMLKGFFDAAPKELESAARIDGSTRIGAMFRIVIPIARNGLVATCVFVAIAAWNEYLFALMLTSSTGSRTWPVGLQLMVGEFQLPWGMLAAGGIISIIPVIVLFALVQRVMVAGITAGAVKGIAPMANLQINGVRKSFGSLEVLKNIDLELDDGGFLVLLGPSGCGKSTLLSIIAGLEPSSGGDILIGGRNVNDVHPKDRNIAMVFQSYALYPTMSVRRNIGFGLEMRKVAQAEREAAVQRAAELLQIEHLLERKPAQLSGGQRQRVAMGRAIVRDPELFLFDEPLSNLDAKLRVEMRTEIKRLHDRLGTSVVYVTHDQVEAMTLGTKVAVMREGVIQQIADPQTIYERPANMFVAGFIGSPTMNFLSGTLEQAGGGLALRHGAGALPLAGLEQDVSAFVGKKVVAGIRPESLSAGTGAATLSGTVDVVEPTGPDTMVLIDVGGQVISARLGSRDRPPLGAPLSVSVDTTAVNLFDPESGTRI